MKYKRLWCLFALVGLILSGCDAANLNDKQDTNIDIKNTETTNQEDIIADFEARMSEKGWDYQYLKSDATVKVAAMDDVDKELAQEIIDSHVYEYVSSVGITFRVEEGDGSIHIEGIGAGEVVPSQLQKDFESRMSEKGWDYQYLKSDATITVASKDDIDRGLAQEIIDSHIYEYVSSVGITFRVEEGDGSIHIEGIGAGEVVPSQLQKDFESRMSEKGWDYQYLKSDATITVASKDDIDRGLAQEIIDSHVYEYVSSVGITFHVADSDEYIHVDGIKE